MTTMTIKRGGHTYALVPLAAWQKMTTGQVTMPAMPPVDTQGRMDAVAFARVSIARGIIRGRTAAGLSQPELARRAGIDSATLDRIEKAKVTPDESTVRKIDRALSKARLNPPKSATKRRHR